MVNLKSLKVVNQFSQKKIMGITIEDVKKKLEAMGETFYVE